MIGAIVGDIIGSIYEFNNIKTKDFELFDERMEPTDDSILTIATADWLLHGGAPGEYYFRYASAYPCPMGGYGPSFLNWVSRSRNSIAEPYNSCGNGSAMRVSPVGWAFDNEEETLAAAERSAECTHNHPEGIKGAESTAAAIFLARNGASLKEISDYIEKEFGYDLSRSLDEIRPNYHHVEDCMETMPEAFECFLKSESYESCLRNVMYIGGDTDTLCAIAGAIAEAYWGIPEELIRKGEEYISEDIKMVVSWFYKKVG